MNNSSNKHNEALSDFLQNQVGRSGVVVGRSMRSRGQECGEDSEYDQTHCMHIRNS